MKIKSLKISNVLTFPYIENMDDEPGINFNENMNIIIGENGSGKSTVLEVLNWIFKSVVFIPYSLDYEHSHQSNSNRLKRLDDREYFNLDKNFNFSREKQSIHIVLEIDETDIINISRLNTHAKIVNDFTTDEQKKWKSFSTIDKQILIKIDVLEKTPKVICTKNEIFRYFENHYFYKEIFDIYNKDNPKAKIDNLTENLLIISAYRNYNQFSESRSFGGKASVPGHPPLREYDLTMQKNSKNSNNLSSINNNEPEIFKIITSKLGNQVIDEVHFTSTAHEAVKKANQHGVVQKINECLKILNIKFEFTLDSTSDWSFTFSFIDIKSKMHFKKFNYLSAGQKAMVHLIFEAYGYHEMKGGLVIIDEPEIHLHYQLQQEYLRLIEKLNNEQKSQYILVTHSDSFINSETIASIIRFSINENRFTKVYQPVISDEQRWLIKMLDNVRSTHIFFCNKVLLVEGETDSYMYRSIIRLIDKKQQCGLIQDISVFHVDGKIHFNRWKEFLEKFGLKVYIIGDLDCVYKKSTKLQSKEQVNDFYLNHSPNKIHSKITKYYDEKKYFLKDGNLEIYFGCEKNLNEVVKFCDEKLEYFLKNKMIADKISELRTIFSRITGLDENQLWQ
jgi:predicted ATP-dependent endonuclease of OLD family